MSTVCILTPVVIGSWPAIASAVFGAASAMGFSVAASSVPVSADPDQSVTTEVANSQVLAELMARGEKISIQRHGTTIEVGVDARGRCTVCASGKGLSKSQLRAIGEEVSGRIVQQFAYHKLMTELKARGFKVQSEEVSGDHSIHVRVSAGS
ncbi:MAG TPA: DUF1257 domain-containing protein [Phycisphaerales bacterium]|nr:DUF1257 domain-containing protein [Phycisphaerales bacterium]